MIGQHVVISGVSVERALDFSTAIVAARGARFVVWMAPGQAWRGRARHTFTVLGATTARLGGRVQLPELLLEADGTCAP